MFPFLRALAHDMATPLTSALGYAQLNVEALGPPEDVRTDFGQIVEASKDLRSKVHRLSRLARYQPSLTVSAASELFIDLKALTESVALSRGQKLTWNIHTSFDGVQLQGNPWLLRATCLALLGSQCSSSCTLNVNQDEETVSLSFPSPSELTSEMTSPDQLGAVSLGERLAEAQSLALTKGSPWILRLLKTRVLE